jgi:methionyl-tRNA formyltransferase
MGNDLKPFWLLSEKKWHQSLFDSLKTKVKGNWFWFKSKHDFTIERLNRAKPAIIFIPHWSHIIPEEIYNHFECIVFHMTDLPYGRGGSPLQNLIVNGKTTTKISAIRVTKGIDTGPVYLKKELSLEGTAREIFERASEVIYEMIIEIIEKRPLPFEQEGDVVVFKRRNANDGNVATLEKLELVYDYIRMLDCEGYPSAFIETPNLKIEFTNASLDNNEITAHVRITKK